MPSRLHRPSWIQNTDRSNSFRRITIVYAKLVQLAESVRKEGPLLVEALKYERDFRNRNSEELSPAAKQFWSRVGLGKVNQLFQVLDDLGDFQWRYCQPRALLKLGHNPGPDMIEETRLAREVLRVFIPDIPDEVMTSLSGRFMHDIW